MTVIVAVTLFMVLKRDLSILVKSTMVGLCVVQGIARVNLHYHTWEQVIAGAVFGSLFALLYFKIFDIVWPKITAFIPSFLDI